MVTRDKAIDSIKAALQETENRLIKKPTYGVYVHAKEQLSLMIKKLNQTALPALAERDFVDIGIMAVKENLEISDPEYADALMLADYDFKMASI